MRKLSLILALSILAAGGVAEIMPAPSYAQVYNYPPPPQNPYAIPWVGPNTPWVYYNGDWFLKGTLYYFFGPQYGWAPYYAYPTTYVVRPQNWYAPRWHAWYQGHPHYWQSFHQTHPYWHGHRVGHHYEKSFYEKHHRGQGGGWHKGFEGRTIESRPSEGRKPTPSRVSRPEGQKPGPARVTQSERLKSPPSKATSPKGRQPSTSQVSRPKGQKPSPGEGKRAPASRSEKAGPGGGKRAPAQNSEKAGHSGRGQ